MRVRSFCVFVHVPLNLTIIRMSCSSDISSDAVPDWSAILSDYIKQEPLSPHAEGTFPESAECTWRYYDDCSYEKTPVKQEDFIVQEPTSEWHCAPHEEPSTWWCSSTPVNAQLFAEGADALQDEFVKLQSMCRQVAACDVSSASIQLNIPHNPELWSSANVQAWLQWLIKEGKIQSSLDSLDSLMQLSGPELVAYCENRHNEHMVPYGPTTCSRVQSQSALEDTVAAHLEIWTSAAQDISSTCNLNTAYKRNLPDCTSDSVTRHNRLYPDSEVRSLLQQTTPSLDSLPAFEDDEVSLRSWSSSPRSTSSPVSSPAPSSTDHCVSVRRNSSHIHLWQFLRELLADPRHQATIRWLDRSRKIFKIEDSNVVAKLWGRRKNRPAMNYDKLSRSIRQYYRKGIMKKTERSQRLVYQFCSG